MDNITVKILDLQNNGAMDRPTDAAISRGHISSVKW